MTDDLERAVQLLASSLADLIAALELLDEASDKPMKTQEAQLLANLRRAAAEWESSRS